MLPFPLEILYLQQAVQVYVSQSKQPHVCVCVQVCVGA